MKTDKKVRIGIVKFFNTIRGYGIIKVNGADEEFVVSINNIINSINENDLVEFEVTKCEKRLTAIKVRVI